MLNYFISWKPELAAVEHTRTSYTNEGLGFDSQHRQEVFLLSIISRQAHPASYKYGYGSIFCGCKAGHLYIVSRSRIVEQYIHSSRKVFMAWRLII
jgi:hypothetical protein